VDDASAEKIARNNAAFRKANDGIEDAVIEQRLDPDELMPFICECSDITCARIIRLTLDEYDHVRSNDRWFAHAVGHEEAIEGAVATVERHSRFILVEKLNHAGEVSENLASKIPEA
jgi:uncharacterized ferritin-like protein (DUF455 family)